MIHVHVQQATEAAYIPDAQAFQRWIQAATEGRISTAEVSIRIIDDQEMQALNLLYRYQNKPTNVLSFPMDNPEFVDVPLLGDVVLCAQVICKEAEQQGKSAEAHWAHMVVHSILHLLGFDHEEPEQAEEMEGIETQIMQGLGYPAPYGDKDE